MKQESPVFRRERLNVTPSENSEATAHGPTAHTPVTKAQQLEPSAADTVAVTDALYKLTELKEKGILSEEEFEKSKARLLSGLKASQLEETQEETQEETREAQEEAQQPVAPQEEDSEMGLGQGLLLIFGALLFLTIIIVLFVVYAINSGV